MDRFGDVYVIGGQSNLPRAIRLHGDTGEPLVDYISKLGLTARGIRDAHVAYDGTLILTESTVNAKIFIIKQS